MHRSTIRAYQSYTHTHTHLILKWTVNICIVSGNNFSTGPSALCDSCAVNAGDPSAWSRGGEARSSVKCQSHLIRYRLSCFFYTHTYNTSGFTGGTCDAPHFRPCRSTEVATVGRECLFVVCTGRFRRFTSGCVWGAALGYVCRALCDSVEYFTGTWFSVKVMLLHNSCGCDRLFLLCFSVGRLHVFCCRWDVVVRMVPL